MKYVEFNHKYPNVSRCLIAIAEDNDFFLTPNLRDGLLPLHMDALEAEAAKLDDDWATFSVGERTQQEEIRDRLGIHMLDEFLKEAFDGEYTEVFFS